MNKKLEFYLQQYLYSIVDNKQKNGDYKFKWNVDKTEYDEINESLKGATKNTQKNGTGKPDLIYFNPETRTLILVEIKKDKTKHSSNKLFSSKNPRDYAVDGVLHYASFFNEYDRFAIACSGDPDDFLIDQFLLEKNGNKPIHIPAQRILNEFDYENIISDNLINGKIDNLSKHLSTLNKKMDTHKIETGKRPIILGTIIFSLTHFKQMKTDIEELKYKSSNISKLLITSIEEKMRSVLPKVKWDNNEKIIQRFCKMIESYSINNMVWKDIIKEVDENLMPIINQMKKQTYHDFSGDMYRVLLRYTSGDGKVLGQVLTPKHIANLMIDLSELKKGDSVLDPACGTGIFLVNSMNKLISMANSKKEIEDIKSKKIYGVEISKEMFFLTLVNMLINDDGKTNIYIDDDSQDAQNRGIFKYEAKDFKERPKKLIMNPPYLSQKEMWRFILKGMDLASERAVIIIPTSILNGNDVSKEEFLRKHSLLSVINMPNNIFHNKGSSGASVKTSILVAEIGKPNKENYSGTYLYDLKDDGFISSKKHGRYDGNNKWNLIKDNFLSDFRLKNEVNGISKNVKNIFATDSWHFNHFNKVVSEDFPNINNYLFNFMESLINKKHKNQIEKEIFKSKLLSEINIQDIKIGAIDFFDANKYLNIEKGYNNASRIEKYDGVSGDISYIAAANQNNGSRLDNIRNIYDETVFKDKITWNTQGDGGAGLAFYHPYKFILASTAIIFDLKDDNNKTLERKLFIAFAMSLEKKNRFHGNSITKREFNDGVLSITLPINENNKVNWSLIDDFMESNGIVKVIRKILNG